MSQWAAITPRSAPIFFVFSLLLVLAAVTFIPTLVLALPHGLGY